MSDAAGAADGLSAAEKRRRLEELLRRRAGESRTYPVSFAQQRLWFLDRLEPGSSAYTLVSAARLDGALRADVLERALAEVVRRHGTLRTVFATLNGEPVQVVAPAAAGPILRVEEPSGTEEERHARADALVAEEAGRALDLARGPLLRVTLLRIGAERHVLVVAMHHAVTDGWSMGVFFGELWTLYGAFLEGRPSPLPELPVQYADYAVWQRKELAGEALDTQLAFWREALDGAPPLLELPIDRPRPAARARRPGARCRFDVDAGLAAALRELGRAEGATPFMTALAAFQLLLARYAGEEDVVVGTPIAGRTRPELEPLVGLFVNTLAIRARTGGDPTFRELLGRTREAVLGAFGHQDLPFERLVEELRVERSLSHTPLFQAMFTLRGAPGRPPELPGLRQTRLEPPDDEVRFDLELGLAEHPDGLRGGFAYDADLFDAATVERMAGHLGAVLRAVAADPDARLSRVPLLGGDERRRLLAEAAGAPRAYPDALVHERIVEQAARAPAAVAVRAGGAALTYGELARRSARLAERLRARGVGPESRVGLCVERSPEMLVGVLGILRAGGAYVPLDPAYPAERLRFVLEDAGISRVVATAAGAAALPGFRGALVAPDAPDGEEDDAPGGGALPHPPSPEGAAYVIYTSGSTGTPKGVVVEHRGLAGTLLAAREEFGLGGCDVAAVLASYAFDIWAFEALAPLLAGGMVRLLPADDVLDVERLVAELEGVGVLHAVPALMRRVVAEVRASGRGTLPRLRLAFVGGDAVPPDLLDEMREVFPGAAVRVLYGPTEATILAASHLVGEGGRVERSVLGAPLGEARAYVLDPHGEPVPLGVAGELYVGGRGVARGYHGRPELTAARFVPDPFGGGAPGGVRLYRTGDRARRLADGTLEFLGRTDAQVKIRGFRIEPGEVEAALAAHPSVSAAAVVAREDAGSGAPGERRLVGYAVPDPEAPPAGAGELRAWLRERLPEHMVPGEVVLLEQLPLTPTGKVDRRALPAPERPLAELEAALGLRRTPTEEVVAAAWADVLRLPGVGPSENFFALGGHSLLATQVVSRLRAAFRVDVPVRALFEAPTVAELAARVDAAVRAGQGTLAPPLERAERGGPLPLSFAQERLWVIDRMDPGGSVYNVPLVLRMRGELDAAALRAALDALVERHESLRTTFPAPGGRPVQVVHPAAGAPFRLEPLDGVAEGEREARALAAAAEEAERPFDLAAGPLFRAVLLPVAADDHLLVLALHHVVADGWSVGVLFRELGALYAALVRNEPPPLAPLPVQYADYAVWQRGWLAGAALERQVAYWREQLAGAPPLLELPTDRPRLAVRTTRGGAHRFRLPAAAAESLRALARAEGATPFMAALACFQLLLSRYSRQDDVVVGTPVAGRTHEALEGLVGMFVNTLALRAGLGGDPPFRELLGRVREATLGAYAHQDLPFEKLVDELRPPRDPGHAPVFQAMFSLHNLPAAALRLPGLALEAVPAESRTTKFDLSLSLADTAGGLAGALEYDAHLFDAGTAARMAAHFATLLEGAAAEPARRLSGLSLLDDAARGRLAAWNDTARETPPGAVHERIAEQARSRPGAPAIYFGGAAVTFAELDAWAGRVAARLRAVGVGPETRVGVAAERGPGLVAAVLGVLRAGGAYVPLDPAYPPDRLAFMLADAAVPVVVAQPSLAARLPELAGAVVPLDVHHPPAASPTGGEGEHDNDTSEAEGQEALPQDRGRVASLREPGGGLAVHPESAAYVVYTSGSTGRPKGVVVTHGGLASLAAVAAAEWGIGPGDTVASHGSFSFDIWVLEVLLPLAAGAAVRPVPQAGVPDVDRLIGELEHASDAFTVPALVRAIAARLRPAGRTLPRLRRVYCGADVVPPELLREMREVFPSAELRVLYGPTEATVACSALRVGDALPERNGIGSALGNVALHVLGPGGEPLPPGVPGELCVGGPQVARGYLGRPGLTAERFVPDPFGGVPGARLYRTGDLVRRMDDGGLEFLGRIDRQAKVRGFRVEPGEVESVLARHPAVRGAVAAVREDRPGDRRLVAYLEADAGFPAAEALELARGTLPEYMVPAAVVVMEKLPLTPAGKVDLRALPAPEAPADAGDAAPRGVLERTIAAAWEEVLGVPVAGVNRSFFDLGGNSLLVAQAASRLEAATGRPVPVLEVFRHPTVAALARRLAGAEEGEAPEPAAGIRPERLSAGKTRLGQLRKRTRDTER